MMVDTRIRGYVFEGWAACGSCVNADDGPYTREDACVYHDGSHEHGASCLDGTGYCERTRGQAVFSHDDDGYGLTCDDCGDIIFETDPDVDHEQGAHDDVDEPVEDCEGCREYFTDHSLHVDETWQGVYHDDWCDDCADIVNAYDERHATRHVPYGSVQACHHCRAVRDREAETERMVL